MIVNDSNSITIKQKLVEEKNFRFYKILQKAKLWDLYHFRLKVVQEGFIFLIKKNQVQSSTSL